MTYRDKQVSHVLQQCHGSTILVADENCLDFPFGSLDANAQVLSNRCDVAANASAVGLFSEFSDYAFSHWPATSVDQVVYRISKEKPVVHHIANQAVKVLKQDGTFWLIGGKQEGIKSIAKSVGKLFDSTVEVSKQGQTYLVRIRKNSASGIQLDDRNYDELRQIFAISDKPVMSKPGLFGWNKIDSGSELLAGYLPRFAEPLPKNRILNLLDLGCGYGYLGLMANAVAKFAITATDNCAAAIIACKRNFNIHDVNGKVLADDCAVTIDSEFDVILCNPPFHQGFQEERKLTEKFLGNTSRLLARNGRALFVVNQFVPLETLAKPFFSDARVPIRTKAFKLVELIP